MGSLEQVLADKYSRFDAASGEPTHDKEGTELDGKVRSLLCVCGAGVGWHGSSAHSCDAVAVIVESIANPLN